MNPLSELGMTDLFQQPEIPERRHGRLAELRLFTCEGDWTTTFIKNQPGKPIRMLERQTYFVRYPVSSDIGRVTGGSTCTTPTPGRSPSQPDARQGRLQRTDEMHADLVDAQTAGRQPALAQDRRQDGGHEAIDRLALLHDRNGVHSTEPGHGSRVVHLAARAQQHGRLVADQQRRIENAVLAGQDLGRSDVR
jgi:hypothetical protein